MTLLAQADHSQLGLVIAGIAIVVIVGAAALLPGRRVVVVKKGGS